MKQIVSAFLTFVLMSATIAHAHDCAISKSVLLPYANGRAATKLDWQQSGEAIENLFVACPAGPASRASRAIFFQLVDSVFKAGESAGREANPDRSEASWEFANQYEFDLRQYMDRIVSEKDLELKSVILKTANARAISRLGPGAKYDVLRIVHSANPARIGAGHHSAYTQAILVLGIWIDPAEKRFTGDEKREMTDVLLEKAAAYHATVNYDQTINAEATLKALGHATAPEVLPALEKWGDSAYPSLREAADAGIVAVKARLPQRDQ
jgi:hypothetical protein